MRFCLLVAVLLTRAAAAEVDAFGLGDGHAGDAVISSAGTVLNAATVLTGEAPAQTLSLPVASTQGFSSGGLVLVVQMGLEEAVADSGIPGPYDLERAGVGHFELARVVGLSPAALSLGEPLTQRFPARVSQVVSVPEFQTLTVLDGGSVVAPPWDGSSGGVVAALVQRALVNHGTLSAAGRGFRGGRWVIGHAAGGCELDQPWPAGAARGEGPALERYGPTETGRGNVLLGGGGGVCARSGGGGGGHLGRGGLGGPGASVSALGGLGGGALSSASPLRLLMGGGGGAGHCPDSRTPSSGGAGGGLVFLRAGTLEGAGVISADGAAGNRAADGAGGGGGAGGTVFMRLRGSAACALVSASGGAGGAASSASSGGGSGGGGGGGLLVLQGTSFAQCTTSIAAGPTGTPGTSGEPSGPFSPGHFGQVTVLPGGYGTPPAPEITEPHFNAAVGPRPLVRGAAAAGSTVSLLVDGVEAGSTEAVDGAFALTPNADLGLGRRRLEAVAVVAGVPSAPSAPVLVLVVTEQHMPLQVGCACDGAPLGALLWSALLLLRRSRRGAPSPRRLRLQGRANR